MNWVAILKHYQEDIKDENVLDEAIATCENYFHYTNKDDLLHRSRPLAMAYLAPKYERGKKEK
ncbi:MAG TPA: hypothetical protein VFC98_00890 [Clostridia bacterium]|nr:hypothetical protein [Clostridia bacterium]